MIIRGTRTVRAIGTVSSGQSGLPSLIAIGVGSVMVLLLSRPTDSPFPDRPLTVEL